MIWSVDSVGITLVTYLNVSGISFYEYDICNKVMKNIDRNKLTFNLILMRNLNQDINKYNK